MSVTLILFIIGAVFVGALMRATFGFGEAVVSMPILALLPIPLHTAISLIGLAGLTVAAMTVSANWRQIQLSILIRLAIATFIGIPVGVLLVKYAPEQIITIALGTFLVCYGVYALLKPRLTNTVSRPLLPDANWALPFGFLAGMLGSAYNFNGVPVVVYGTLRRWDPNRFRGMLQAHFLISGVMVVAGQALGGLWTQGLWELYGLSIPAIIGATILGVYLHRHIPAKRFEIYVFWIIILLGVLLVINHI